MAYKILVLIALLAIYSGHFADAENKCEDKLGKEYLKDCEASGDHPPEECKVDSSKESDNDCLRKHCAKECQEAGGDEVLTYRVNWPLGIFRYFNVICCKSKNEEQAKNTESSIYSVKNLLGSQG